MAWADLWDRLAFDGDIEACGWSEAPTPLNDMAGVIKESTEGQSEQWCRLNHINGSLALAAEPLAQSEWDTDPDLLALPAGRAVDLLTGERRFPRPRRIGKRAVAWREDDIERWLAQCAEADPSGLYAPKRGGDKPADPPPAA